MAEHLYTYTNPTNPKHLEKACRVLSSGGVLAYPTDVNWAIGCDASNSKALKRVFAIKKAHPKERPLSFLCSNVSMISQIAAVEHVHYRLLKRAFPGPYTIFLKPQKKLARKIGEKREKLGVRVPENALLLDLIEAYGSPLATSSLVFEEERFTYGYEVERVHGHALDLILDLGEEVIPRETTIIDLTEGEPELVREGEGKIDFL